MKMEEIMKLIEMLAKSNGFYGRLLNQIAELPEHVYNELKKEWEEQNFKDDIEFILWLEG